MCFKTEREHRQSSKKKKRGKERMRKGKAKRRGVMRDTGGDSFWKQRSELMQ